MTTTSTGFAHQTTARFTAFVLRHVAADLAPFEGTFYARCENDNATDPVKADARAAEIALRVCIAETMIGQVVSFHGRPRRFVVTGTDCLGTLYLSALSGSVKGSSPSSVLPSEVTVHMFEAVTFSGKLAPQLQAKAAIATAMHASMTRHREARAAK